MSDYECEHCKDTGKCQDEYHSGFFSEDGPSTLNVIDNMLGSCPSCGSGNTEYAPCPHCSD